MSSDWLTQVPSQLFAYVLQIPFLVTLAISAASIRKDAYGRWGKEFILVLFGAWLFVWWIGLTILQIAMNMPREDPFHAGEIYYGFPSSVGFYVSTLIFFVIEFSYLWNIQFSRMYWIGMYLTLIGPSVVLCWFQFNSWQEVALSMGLGLIVTTVFILFYYYCIVQHIPLLIVSEPFTWMSCVDTWTQDDRGKWATEQMRRSTNA